MWLCNWGDTERPSSGTGLGAGFVLGLTLILISTTALGARSEPALLAVQINALDTGDVVPVLTLGPHSYAVPMNSLRAWRLKLPPGHTNLPSDHGDYVALADIVGLDQHLDLGSQTLVLQVPANAFDASVVGSTQATGPVGLTASQAGGFFNYDVQWQHTQNLQSSVQAASGLFEAGYFNTAGTGLLTGLWNNADPTRPHWVRLDTQWTVDQPERRQSLRWGDSIGQPGSWGRAVRFGGFQWASNFATQPGFIPFVLPSVRGEAVLPSTLDVYVNNTRQLQTQVPAGPFDLPNIPAITGQGTVQLVLKDVLGRQQTLVQPYFVSPRLLQPGVRDFSLDFGAIREDYGLASTRYGRGMATLTERLGVTDGFTRELRAELLRNQATVGGGGVWRLPALMASSGTAGANAAFSQGPQGGGQQFSMSADRQSARASLGVQAQHTSPNFVQVGLLPGMTPRQSLGATLGAPLGNSTLGISYLRQSTWEGNDTRLLTASCSMHLGAVGQLGAYVAKDLSGKAGFAAGVLLTRTLDPTTSVSAELARQGGHASSSVQVQGNPPAGDGVGYRLLAGHGASDRQLASGSWQTPRGTFTGEAARFGTDTGYRVGASGGVAVAAGELFVGRRIDESFAVVQVGHHEGVRVYRDNQEVARTNSNGMALVTRLRAYQANPVSIEPDDLPLATEVSTLELRLTPRLRSGVSASFPFRDGRSVLVQLLDASQQPLPAGSVLKVAGQSREFVVGYGGQAFLNGLGSTAQLTGVQRNGRPCSLQLSLDTLSDPLPDLGPQTCQESAP